MLVELFPGEDQLPARGPDGAYRHQLVMAFLAPPTHAKAKVPPTRMEPMESFHGPGSEWLYGKLYLGIHASERFLAGPLASLIREAKAEGMVDRWFFIRYRDPEPHLRIRVLGDPPRLAQEVLPRLNKMVGDLRTRGTGWGFQLETYVPETLRYGGPGNLEDAERVFMADSEAAVEILGLGLIDPSARWRLALASIDAYFEAAALDLDAKLRQAIMVRNALRHEFQLDHPDLRRRLGERYRSVQPLLPFQANHHLSGGLAILEARTEGIRPLLRAMRRREKEGSLMSPFEGVLESLIHMSLNRLLPDAQRVQEAIVYDFLVRQYTSFLASRSTSKSRPILLGSKR